MTYSTKVQRLLFEAYRLNDMADEFERRKPLTKRWLGLGTEAVYRPAIKAGLMRFFDGQAPPKSCMGWLCLTDAGVRAFEELRPQLQQRLEDLKSDTSYQRSYESRYVLAGGNPR